MARSVLVGFDIDGVILDFYTSFWHYWNKVYSKEYGTLPLDNDTWSVLPDSDSRQQMVGAKMQEFIDTEPTLPLVEEEITQTLNTLHSRCRVVLVTSYPHLESRKVNLKDLNVKYDEMVHVVPKEKVRYLQKRGCICMVEDCPSTVESIARIGLPTFVPAKWKYTRGLDEKHESVQLYESCEQLTNMILALVEAHNVSN